MKGGANWTQASRGMKLAVSPVSEGAWGASTAMRLATQGAPGRAGQPNTSLEPMGGTDPLDLMGHDETGRVLTDAAPVGSHAGAAALPGAASLPDAVIAGLDDTALLALSGGDQAASIARQVADMAQGLAALADRLVGQNRAMAASGDVVEADCIAFLEGQFRIRRLRARHLHGLSLGEPAWDILLDLAVAQYWRRETSVTSLCIAADVPSTTALRWINGMTKAGLIVRRPCLRDGRRSFLAIAPATYQAMLALAADSLRSVEKVRTRYQRSAA
jgi:DNA-binding MarR family transcriptional regulator